MGWRVCGNCIVAGEVILLRADCIKTACHRELKLMWENNRRPRRLIRTQRRHHEGRVLLLSPAQKQVDATRPPGCVFRLHSSLTMSDTLNTKYFICGIQIYHHPYLLIGEYGAKFLYDRSTMLNISDLSLRMLADIVIVDHKDAIMYDELLGKINKVKDRRLRIIDDTITRFLMNNEEEIKKY
jgi:hypothetical protein